MAVSGFKADTRSKQDLVGIGTEVNAFSYLIANKDLQPPLAIGLFGDWGSGKSYFMQSLKERIYKITADARESKKPQKDIKIFKHIVQIEFNAWHYVEGELWASLVESIFQNLQMQSEDTPTLLQKRQQVVIERLESFRREQGMAQVLKDELHKQLLDKKNEIAITKAELDKKLKELNDLKIQDFLAEIDIQDAERAKYNKLLDDYGVKEVATTAADFLSAIAGLRAVLERGNALTMVLRQRGWKWMLGIVGVVVSGPLISILLTFLLQNQISELTNALLSVSVFLAGLTAILKNGTMKLSEAIGQVEQAQFELDGKKRQAEKTYVNNIKRLEDELAGITSTFKNVQCEEREISRQIEALEKELLQITPRRVMLDFIQERAVSEDYRKRLGIAALIRRDFEQLWKLIEEDNKKFIEDDIGEMQAGDEHRINRIVLYIDDLDRCPPERVVQVLQAIHLLLAFPLFVVVVAVDSRWLSQSLYKQYEGLLSANQPEKVKNGGMRPATSQNYLEKIFQIPFWVRPLSENARMRIVDGLVFQPLEFAKSIGGKEKGQKQRVIAWPKSGQVQEYIAIEKTEMNPKGLETKIIELEFIEKLSSLLGQTPRSVKRFVNLYWLMKSMALTHSPSFMNENDKYSEYKQVLLLLAVLTGLPSIATEFFKQLHRTEPVHKKIAAEMGTNVTGGSMQTLKELIAEVKRKVQGSEENAEEALSELVRLEFWFRDQANDNWLDMPLSQLGVWATQVRRFSYQMEEV